MTSISSCDDHCSDFTTHILLTGHSLTGSHSTTLPPFSSLETMGPPRGQHTNVSSVRYNAGDQTRPSANGPESASSSKRGLPASNAASADTSDAEDDNSELPASGLVAPWEVLRGLADVAIERAAKVGNLIGDDPDFFLQLCSFPMSV